MSPDPDPRIPVRFAPVRFMGSAPADAAAAWLIQGEQAAPGPGPVARFRLPPATAGHPAGCACCVPRGPVAEALSRLFLARARGEVVFFRDVLALPLDADGAVAIRDALAGDSLLAARFRLMPDISAR